MGHLLTHNNNPNPKIHGILMKVIYNFSPLYNGTLCLICKGKWLFRQYLLILETVNRSELIWQYCWTKILKIVWTTLLLGLRIHLKYVSSLGFVLLCFVFFVFFFLPETEFLCIKSPCCPRTCSVDQIGLELTETHLLLVPEYWD